MKVTLGGFESPFESPLAIPEANIALNYRADEIPQLQQDYYFKDFPIVDNANALFDKLSKDLFQYKIFPASIMKHKVCTEGGTIERDALILQRIKLGPICINTAVKVLEKIQEDTSDLKRSEFRYGTLLGHPEKGEAWFRLTLNKASRLIKFEMGASSKPGNILSSLGTPISRYLQKTITQLALKDFGIH